MPHDPIETEYLVVGTGATALAFVDTILDATDARIVMVDRRDRVGGHWNDAYSFVRLHQPSAWYGVASRPIAERDPDARDEDDRGASGIEVLDYFDRLMRDRFLASGRVRWLPMHEYYRGEDGAHRIRSLVTGDDQAVAVRRRVVDATLTRTEIPATHPPRYAVAHGVRCIPPNLLPELRSPFSRYTVIGAGKTGMDACLWLLDHDVPASRIRWVVPRDAWFLDRANLRGGPAHVANSLRSLVRHYEALAEFRSLPDLFSRLEEGGVLHRLDPSVEPAKCRGAVTSRREMARLRRIEDVVRLGRVRAIDPTRLTLDGGVVEAEEDTLYVDCSASAIHTPASIPVFEGEIVRLLMVTWGQPLFSAALIAHVEATVDDEAERNALCGPVVFADGLEDWPAMWGATLANAARWRQHAGVQSWVRRCRLNGVAAVMHGVAPDDPVVLALVRDIGVRAAAATARLGEWRAGKG